MKITEFMKSKKGASGIGTLIVFIAMVLVAAVAASVLINTSGFLQQKAATTGKESTEQVASGLQVLNVMGYTSATNVDYVAIYATPNAGSSSIDLSQATLMISAGTNRFIKTYDSEAANLAFTDYEETATTDKNIFATDDATGNDCWKYVDTADNEFGIAVIQDADNTVSAANPVINKGDIVVITMKKGTLSLSTRTPVSGEIQPEFGAPGVISFTTPATYLNGKVVELQ
ncbi:flagellin [Methanococcus maripaludis]|uniref:Flagellin n=2 Tax=Methanococcus maripaludis TaxID=39152 RepID=A0A7J9PFY1_METMI|nr:flagellin [Methanococcus maripaludis]MBA2861666.1 flagellin FlaB [Methanococcus maripaludis]